MMKYFSNNNSQKGQTLIETLVAAFILTMGISAALGLANYSLSATTGIRHQTVALGLAREGIEVVKNMRDTNWLRGGDLDSDCHDFLVPPTTAYCYKDWLTAHYRITPGVYVLSYDPGTGDDMPWNIVAPSSYGLDVNETVDITGVKYTPAQSGSGNSGFYRKITLEEDTSFSPFSWDIGGRVKVTSQVWWEDKKCPARADISAGEPCSITLETYLTNWRNF